MPEKIPKRIPYDALTLAAVVHELQDFVDGKIQRVTQPDSNTLTLNIYARGKEASLLLSCHPQFARAHFVTRRYPNPTQPPAFCATVRARADGGRLISASQRGFDRVLHLVIAHELGEHTIIAELMGKHSNLMLLDESERVISAAKWVRKEQSSRPIQAGIKYSPPPFPPRPSVLTSEPGDDLRQFEGASPFLIAMAEADPGFLAHAAGALKTGGFSPVISHGFGAYPFSVAVLGFPELPRSSISVALEQHFDQAIPAAEADALRANLVSQLERVLLARDVALGDLRQAEEAGGRAGEWQRLGELILAYGSHLSEGASVLTAFDYDGTERVITLDPELDFKENANAFFDRAKKAKGRMGLVRDQIGRLAQERVDISALLHRVQSETRLSGLRDLHEEAGKHRWLHSQPVPTKNKEDRPYEGNKIRELLAPGGWKVLFGENSEANDYLTLRVAKPNDYWLHIRGSTSAHVVVVTQNHPEKVSKEALEFAAKIAVQHSPSKHAGFVPVDYTLKKYVRKPRGAQKGTALYTHEKTIHIEGN